MYRVLSFSSQFVRLSLAILFSCLLLPAALGARATLPLDGAWYFIPRLSDRGEGGRMDYESADAIRSTWRKIEVPSCWQRQFEDLKYFEGVAWYSRDFEFDGDPESSDSRLVFEGVNYLCRVWLNGVALGDHEGGYTTFELPVCDALRRGKNTLAVRVDNRRHLLKVPGDVGWFNYGGIYRSVRLETRPLEHIENVYARTDRLSASSARISVVAELYNSSRQPPIGNTLEIALLGRDGRLAAADTVNFTFAGTSHVVSEDIALKGSNLNTWSPGNPYRYTLRLRLKRGGGLIDEWQTRFGVHTFAVDGNQVLLNGKPFRARGICYLYDFPGTGRTFDPATFATDLANFRELGLNIVRNHFPFDPRMLEAFDSLGILVWQDVPVYWVDSYDRHTVLLARQQAREMALADRNRACMAVWSLGNENSFPKSDRRVLFSELGDEIRRYVPDAVTSAALFTSVAPEMAGLVDIISVNIYPGWYNFLGHEPIMWTADSLMLEQNLTATRRDLAETVARLPSVPFWISEIGGAGTRDLYLDQPWRLFGQPYQAYLVRRQLEMVSSLPQLGGILQFLYNDFYDPSRMEAPEQEGKNLKGCVTIDRQRKQSFAVIKEFYNRWGR